MRQGTGATLELAAPQLRTLAAAGAVAAAVAARTSGWLHDAVHALRALAAASPAECTAFFSR